MNTTDHTQRFLEEKMETLLSTYICPKEHLEPYYYLITKIKDQEININENIQYQFVFCSYYYMHKNRFLMNAKNIISFFNVFEDLRFKIVKTKDKDCFAKVIECILKGLNTTPDSETLVFLCSALLHTIKPNFPIWDPRLLDYFGFMKSYPKKNDYIKIYSEYKTKCELEISGKGAFPFRAWKDKLDNRYKHEKYFDINNFTDIKKMDLFFWKEKHFKASENQDQNFEKYKKYNVCLFSEDDKNDNDIDYIMQRALVGKLLKLLRDGIVCHMEHVTGEERLMDYIKYYIKIEPNEEKHIPNNNYDCDVTIALKILKIIGKEYNNLILDYNAKITIDTLIDYRNEWAHFNPSLRDHIHGFLSDLIKLFRFINAKEKVKEVERIQKCLSKGDLIPKNPRPL